MSKARKQFKNNDKKPEFALIYCRVSSERQKNEGHGLDGQEHRCKEFALRKGYSVEKVFRDSYTGAGDFMDRPAMVALLKHADDNPHKNYAVIFDDLSRFARDVTFHIKLRKEFDIRNITPECLNFNFEDTPEGQMIEMVMAAQNQYHRSNNRRQVIQKQKARLEKGYWGFAAKKGYEQVVDPFHGKICKVNSEGLILKKALEDFANGLLVRKIDVCKFLREAGFWQKQIPEKYIHKISEIMQDPFYAGYIEYPIWEVSRRKGIHEGIISIETFDLIQKRLKKGNTGKRIRLDISNDFPMRGLIKCGCCGSHITAGWSKGRSERYAYYSCHNKPCEMYKKALPKNAVELGFESILKKNTLKPEITKLLVRVFDSVWENEVLHIKEKEIALEKQKQEIKQKISDLTDMIIKTKSIQVKKVYEDQIEILANELEKIDGESISNTDLNIPYRTALEKSICLLKSPYNVWQNVDVYEKHKLFFFLFEEKLAYSKKEGYRTDNLPSAVSLFEEFATTNPRDVEMGGIEPPCKEEQNNNLHV